MKDPSVNFYLIKRYHISGNDQALFRLIMSVSFEKKRLIHYTGILSSAIEWDKELQQFKGVNPDYRNLNAYLRNLRQSAINIYRSLSIKDSFVSIKDFRIQLGKYKISPGYELVDAFIRFMELNYHSWSDSSYRKCKSLLNHLLRFREKKHSQFILEGVDENFMLDLVSYLDDQGLNRNSVKGYVNVMNWFLNWTVQNKLMINTGFRNFRLVSKDSDISTDTKQEIYLYKNETAILINAQFDQVKLERVRDMFLFMVFSGCRFSEMIMLKREDINEDSIMISGRNKRIIPQNKLTRVITDRYHNIYFRENRFFPSMSNITFNKYLRLMSGKASLERMIKIRRNEEIDEVPLSEILTINTAFETFLVNCILMDISLPQIQKWTGRTLVVQYKRLRNRLCQNEETAINKINAYYESSV